MGYQGRLPLSSELKADSLSGFAMGETILFLQKVASVLRRCRN